VHDELVFEAPKDEADKLCKLAKDVMEAAPDSPEYDAALSEAAGMVVRTYTVRAWRPEQGEVDVDLIYDPNDIGSDCVVRCLISDGPRGDDRSFDPVIGDRLTDIQLAKNLGCRGIWLNGSPQLGATELPHGAEALQKVIALATTDWADIWRLLHLPARSAQVRRTTNETDISIRLLLDGQGRSKIHTGLGFFDHILEQLARHSGCDLDIEVKGDLHIDEHHTIEDTALALGEAFHSALGSKLGMERYGFCLPMDDCLAQVAIDFGGRPWLVWEASFQREKIGDVPTEMFFHFFKSFSDAARCNLFISVQGDNEHHKIEAIFKALARSVKMALRRDPERMVLPSTKGML